MNLFLILNQTDWRPDGDAEVPPGPLNVQIIARTVEPVLGDDRRPTGWMRCQAWRYTPAQPAPELVRVQVRAQALEAGR